MALAGTDANVFFQLIGDEGETEKIQLRQGGKAEKRFEKGRVDKFIVETVDVGKVKFSVHRCGILQDENKTVKCSVLGDGYKRDFISSHNYFSRIPKVVT